MITPRKSYTATYKLSVLQFAEERSIKEACLKFHIDPSMISRWKSKQEAFSSAKKTCKRVGLSGRPVSYPVEEGNLFNWILELRSKEKPVTFDDIKEKMISLCLGFKASYSWLKGFLKRFNLSLRTICSSSSSLSQEQIKERIQSFGDFMKKHSHDRRIINMDQTPVWMSIGSTGKTVHFKGAKNVAAYLPKGINPREKISVILACDSAGEKLPPAIIVKSGKRAPSIQYINNVLVNG